MLVSSAMLAGALVLLAVAADSAAVSNATASNATACDAVNTNRNLNQYAQAYLTTRNNVEIKMDQIVVTNDWNYDANLTEANRAAKEETDKQEGEFEKHQWQIFQDVNWSTNWKCIKDPDLRRQFEMYSEQGISALPAADLAKYNKLVGDMTSIYSKAEVHLCVVVDNVTSCNLRLEPDLTNVMTKVRSAGILQDVWVKWRDVSGSLVREQFIKYVALSNKAARLNDYNDMGEMWISSYEDENFHADVKVLWQDLKPLYQQLHAYVRRKLREKYGSQTVPSRGPIPASLLGNMWAQSWEGIYDLLMPYPNKPSLDVTGAMKEQGYTPLKMFHLADKFFTELNLTSMMPKFWTKSVMVNPPHTEMVCHASAWDFYKHDDFRIKMCTDVTMTDLITIHHEMGHIEYYLQYRQQPYPYRTGANPGFHEAVGDSLALSVQTPKHLHKIGLLATVVDDKEADINFLLKVALDKVAFLPFGYLIDKYRWDVFSGNITSDNLNCGWWKLRYEMQGLKPPVLRTEKDFDPGAKFHVVNNVPYIRYFVSFIVQFQFHKAMCIKAGQYDPNNASLPLHKCDIDHSAAAGNALASMLQMGASRPWPDALEKLTGSRKMDVNVLREYFKPLEAWLTADNKKHGEFIGWERDGDYCV